MTALVAGPGSPLLSSLRLFVVWLSLLEEFQTGTVILLVLFVRQELDGFGLPFLCLLEVTVLGIRRSERVRRSPAD